ncbi:MAG: DUF1343 domain-containing protein [Leptospiraceae bacterium]|nr:DUF1343 domain-containing protein [Leptospiraceae bacterium]MCB1303708.1 DUF1343 domain-containing protein [Leptospiraceae bacterium]
MRRYSSYILLLAAVITSCYGSCSTGPLYPGLEHSILDIQHRDGVRIRLFTLSDSDVPEPEEESDLLPIRRQGRVLSGLDILEIDDFRLLRNKSFALLTNATGLNRNLIPDLDLLMQAGVRPSLILEPEHGLYSHEDQFLPGGIRTEGRYGIPLLSLYSTTRKPRADQLEGLDMIVVDIQNLPVRCYTYISTLTYLMEAAEASNIEIVILDRPHPYGFWKATGPYLRSGYESFVSLAPVPYLYSMTMGEYALYMAQSRYRNLRLSILEVKNYEREDADIALQRAWINPSPNIPDLETALVYAGVVFFEGTNVSLGRGTTRPFVYSGAPWMDADAVLQELRKLNLPGVSFARAVFTPTASLYRGQTCRGIQIIPRSYEFDPIRTGFEYMKILHRLHWQFQFQRRGAHYFTDYLWGDSGYREAVLEGQSFSDFHRTYVQDGIQFEELTKDLRLYQD